MPYKSILLAYGRKLGTALVLHHFSLLPLSSHTGSEGQKPGGTPCLSSLHQHHTSFGSPVLWNRTGSQRRLVWWGDVGLVICWRTSLWFIILVHWLAEYPRPLRWGPIESKISAHLSIVEISRIHLIARGALQSKILLEPDFILNNLLRIYKIDYSAYNKNNLEIWLYHLSLQDSKSITFIFNSMFLMHFLKIQF